jgi:hypothetical protein|tara:strand:+ start:168 stop:1223 length:1056 start_codon:yes stop_codon:yes gene_type:complete
MNDLKFYTNDLNTGKIEDYLRQADAFNLLNIDTDDYKHRAQHVIKEKYFPEKIKNNVILLESIISFSELLPKINEESKIIETMANLSCGRIEKNQEKYEHHFEYLSLNIKEYMLQRKIIFIIFGICDYIVINEDSKNTYVGHSTSLILVPEEKQYTAYYVNSHGEDMKTTNFYDVVLSNRRKKKYTYTKPLDIIFMENYIDYLNKMEYDPENNEIINFTDTSKHVYYGANLQCGDSHGICFVYPMIIWYYFGKYFTKTREIKTKKHTYKLSKGSTLLKHGKISLFIESMFVDFNRKYNDLVYDELSKTDNLSSEKIQYLVAVQQTRFTKNVLKCYIQLITQDYFKKHCRIN